MPMEAFALSEGFHKKFPPRRCWCPHQRQALIDITLQTMYYSCYYFFSKEKHMVEMIFWTAAYVSTIKYLFKYVCNKKYL